MVDDVDLGACSDDDDSTLLGTKASETEEECVFWISFESLWSLKLLF